MRVTEPKVYLIGETKVLDEGLNEYLNDVGAPEWTTDAPSDSEKLIEVYGRLCYKSWKPGLNKNVTRVRQGNEKYIGHIVEVGHGSVTECATTNWIFKDVSRVLTHELVRHRTGTHISQESLRYVRLDDIGVTLPPEILEEEYLRRTFLKAIESSESSIKVLEELLNMDDLPFSEKKKLTSTLRRLAPCGLSTTIGWSANMRTLRHVIEMRTHRSAEWEIRVVFDEVAKIAKERYPNMFADYKREEVDDIGEWTTENNKI